MKTALGLLKAPDVHLSANTSGYETSDDPPALPAGLPPLGPIRIRNLEDILKRLQHHLQHHQVPEGSSNPLAMGMSSLFMPNDGTSSNQGMGAQSSISSQQQQQAGSLSSASGAGASSTTVPLANNNNNGGSSSNGHLF